MSLEGTNQRAGKSKQHEIRTSRFVSLVYTTEVTPVVIYNKVVSIFPWILYISGRIGFFFIIQTIPLSFPFE